MLPDFPRVRSLLNDLLNEEMEQMVARRQGILNMARRLVIHEGNRMRLRRFDGTVDEKGLEEIKSQITIRQDKLAEGGLAAVREAIQETAQDVAAQQSKVFFDRVREAVQDSGQVVDAKGKPLTFDLVLKMLEQMPIDFDEQGRPEWPSIVCGSRVFEKLRKMEITDEQERRMSKLIEQKRLEWRDRESDRKLVG